MRLKCVWSFLLSCVCLGGCSRSSGSQAPLQIDLVVESDPGVRLADVPIRIDGTIVGRTGSHGTVRARVRRPPGSLLHIRHDCPAGHQTPTEDKRMRLRGYRSDGASSQVEIRLWCRPTERLGAFVIRAVNAPDILVRLNGRLVARTNEAGVAHFASRAPPGTEYLIELDARGRPELLPRSASRSFTQPDSDELFVVDRTFRTIRKTVKRRPKSRRIIKIE